MKRSFREPDSRPAAISDGDTLVYRGLDTSYFSKWAGIWIPPFKYLDYHAYRVNGEWLSPWNVEETVLDGSLEHRFSLESLQVSEKLQTLEESAGAASRLEVKNVADHPTAVRVGLEAGVDIREKSEDMGPESYRVEKTERSVELGSEARSLTLEPSREPEFSGEPHTKVHEPGGEGQRCVVPGELGFRWELEPGEKEVLEVAFVTDREPSAKPEDPVGELDGYLEQGFSAASRSIHNLAYGTSGGGFLAGHPWFQSYWARDSFWTVLGALDCGMVEHAERTLLNFAERNLPGRIFLDKGSGEDFPRYDTYPLFVIAADRLSSHRELEDSIQKAMESAMEELETDSRGVVDHSPEATWMDTLERTKAVDIQSLWLEAARIAGNPREDELREGLDRFLEQGYPRDHLGEDSPRAVNATIPLMFGQIDEERASEYLQTLNAEFSSLYGARTRSVTDPGYSSTGYHTGSVWGLTTGWAAAANLNYGNARAGMNFLERLASSGDSFQPGGFPECVAAESGELLGCSEQAWSAAMLVHVTDRYLLGIEVEGGEPRADPAADVECRREKRVGDTIYVMEVAGGEAEIVGEREC